jgi:hypothetical protein
LKRTAAVLTAIAILMLSGAGCWKMGSPVSASASAFEDNKSGEARNAVLTWRELSPDGQSEKMMKSLAEAYPEKISRVAYRGGDWAVLLEGKWYACAGGRLLPEEFLPRKEDYAPQSFYAYFSGLPEWKAYEGEEAERMNNLLREFRAHPPKRDSSFFDALWGAGSSDEARAHLAWITFFGKSVRVHQSLTGRFAKIEARIAEAAKTDPAVRYWVSRIDSVSAWNWRNVAATVSRSFHAYGVAVDILPKNIDALELHVYWQWSATFNDEWYNIPYDRRWHPPEEVIKAFESCGFCWGGKWALFDAMHFEYRPEILLMHDLPVEDCLVLLDGTRGRSAVARVRDQVEKRKGDRSEKGKYGKS